MHTKMKSTFLALSLLAASLPRAGAGTAFADTLPQDVRGAWHGFYRGIEDPNIRGALGVVLTVQQGRRFEGAISGASCASAVEGTVAASGNVSFVSRSGEACRVVGKVQLVDGGLTAAVLDGRLSLDLPDGTRAEATLLLLRNFVEDPNIAPPDVSGAWRGSATSDVTGGMAEISAGFTRSGPATRTGFEGVMTILPCVYPEVRGTVDASGLFVAIAQGEDEDVLLRGRIVRRDDGTLHGVGSYHMEHDHGPQDFGTFEIERTGAQ